MRLTIIIVNFKTEQLVLDCIESIYKYDISGVEIIIVDNDSKDGLEKKLHKIYPNMVFINMGYNAGFARANNAGIKIAKGENILLLNSDTINLQDAVNKCDRMLRESSYIAAGVQLLNPDLSPQISGSYAMTGGLNYLLPLPYTGNLLKKIAGIAKIKKPSIQETKDTIEVDWINGAFLMVKKNVIEQAGIMDEDFFLYAEEAEWCSRIKRYGRLCIFGELNVIHLQGESANNAFGSVGKGYLNLFDRKGLQIMLSNFVRIRKQFGISWFLFDLIIYFLTIPVFFLGTLMTTVFFSNGKKYTIEQAKGFGKNMFQILKFIPIIIRNKPFFYKVL